MYSRKNLFVVYSSFYTFLFCFIFLPRLVWSQAPSSYQCNIQTGHEDYLEYHGFHDFNNLSNWGDMPPGLIVPDKTPGAFYMFNARTDALYYEIDKCLPESPSTFLWQDLSSPMSLVSFLDGEKDVIYGANYEGTYRIDYKKASNPITKIGKGFPSIYIGKYYSDYWWAEYQIGILAGRDYPNIWLFDPNKASDNKFYIAAKKLPKGIDFNQSGARSGYFDPQSRIYYLFSYPVSSNWGCDNSGKVIACSFAIGPNDPSDCYFTGEDLEEHIPGLSKAQYLHMQPVWHPLHKIIYLFVHGVDDESRGIYTYIPGAKIGERVHKVLATPYIDDFRAPFYNPHDQKLWWTDKRDAINAYDPAQQKFPEQHLAKSPWMLKARSVYYDHVLDEIVYLTDPAYTDESFIVGYNPKLGQLDDPIYLKHIAPVENVFNGALIFHNKKDGIVYSIYPYYEPYIFKIDLRAEKNPVTYMGDSPINLNMQINKISGFWHEERKEGYFIPAHWDQTGKQHYSQEIWKFDPKQKKKERFSKTPGTPLPFPLPAVSNTFFDPEQELFIIMYYKDLTSNLLNVIECDFKQMPITCTQTGEEFSFSISGGTNAKSLWVPSLKAGLIYVGLKMFTYDTSKAYGQRLYSIHTKLPKNAEFLVFDSTRNLVWALRPYATSYMAGTVGTFTPTMGTYSQ